MFSTVNALRRLVLSVGTAASAVEPSKPDTAAPASDAAIDLSRTTILPT
jgi:hypothetical protein